MKLLLFILYISFVSTISGQNYPPAVGISGTTAIHKDSSVFVDWAKKAEVQRGYIKISDTNKIINNSNRASFGEDSFATDKADGMTGVVSLGDGGTATLFFDPPITNGEGYDFAVFENGFFNGSNSENAFLELAYVEVSTDGINFVRFPAISQTNNFYQLSAFESINTRYIDNLAGKYTVDYGTPFDLSILENENYQTIINTKHISYIKLIDVVGSIDSLYANFDSENNVINDPFPTPFNSSGFDLDAVGVINNIETENIERVNINIYPNPFIGELNILSNELLITKIEIFNIFNKKIIDFEENSTFIKHDLSFLNKGIYFLHVSTKQNDFFYKIIKI